MVWSTAGAPGLLLRSNRPVKHLARLALCKGPLLQFNATEFNKHRPGQPRAVFILEHTS